MLLGTCTLLVDVTLAYGQSSGSSAPAVVRAKEEATISSEIQGVIEQLPFETGDAFSEGEVLGRLDCRVYEAEAEAARAESAGATATFLSRQSLQTKGGLGKTDVEIARAASAAALAKQRVSELRVDACEFVAPFDGRVAEHFANEFEFVETSQPVLSIVSTEEPDLEIIAPAEWLSWIRVGWRGDLQLTAVGGTHSITITGIGPVVDPVSRTVKLTAILEDDVDGILPGMSGLIQLEKPW